MKPDEQNSSGEQGSKTRGGAVGEDRSKAANFDEGSEAAGARNGAVADDRSKGASFGSETGTRGGAVGDDRSKDLGGPEDHPKS